MYQQAMTMIVLAIVFFWNPLHTAGVDQVDCDQQDHDYSWGCCDSYAADSYGYDSYESDCEWEYEAEYDSDYYTDACPEQRDEPGIVYDPEPDPAGSVFAERIATYLGDCYEAVERFVVQAALPYLREVAYYYEDAKLMAIHDWEWEYAYAEESSGFIEAENEYTYPLYGEAQDTCDEEAYSYIPDPAVVNNDAMEYDNTEALYADDAEIDTEYQSWTHDYPVYYDDYAYDGYYDEEMYEAWEAEYESMWEEEMQEGVYDGYDYYAEAYTDEYDYYFDMNDEAYDYYWDMEKQASEYYNDYEYYYDTYEYYTEDDYVFRGWSDEPLPPWEDDYYYYEVDVLAAEWPRQYLPDME